MKGDVNLELCTRKVDSTLPMVSHCHTFLSDSPPAATEGILIEELLSRHLLLRETFRRIPRL